jgi:hypothetical protein
MPITERVCSYPAILFNHGKHQGGISIRRNPEVSGTRSGTTCASLRENPDESSEWSTGLSYAGVNSGNLHTRQPRRKPVVLQCLNEREGKRYTQAADKAQASFGRGAGDLRAGHFHSAIRPPRHPSSHCAIRPPR